MDNFRSPQKIVQTINKLNLTAQPVHARSVFAGDAPVFHTYEHQKKLGWVALEQCLRQLLEDGFSPNRFAVVTFAGRERSEVL